jgi:hypothetical protein
MIGLAGQASACQDTKRTPANGRLKPALRVSGRLPCAASGQPPGFAGVRQSGTVTGVVTTGQLAR